MKKNVVVLLVLCFLFTLLPTQLFAEEFTFEPMAFQYLSLAKSSISYKGDGVVRIFGETGAIHEVSEIQTKVVIQIWQNSNWVNYLTYEDRRTNSSYSVLNRDVTLPKNNYYRIMGFHYVTHHGYQESATTTTGSIYAN